MQGSVCVHVTSAFLIHVLHGVVKSSEGYNNFNKCYEFDNLCAVNVVTSNIANNIRMTNTSQGQHLLQSRVTLPG